MPGMRSSLPAVALACGALLAGCGSSGSNTSSSSSAPKPTPTVTVPSTAASVPSKPTPTTSTSTAAGVPGGAAAVAEYAAICNRIVHSAPGLSSSVKAKVEGICAKAADGDAAGAKTAAKEVCTEIVEATPVAAAIKEKALASCQGT